jgi:hypothetical protein
VDQRRHCDAPSELHTRASLAGLGAEGYAAPVAKDVRRGKRTAQRAGHGASQGPPSVKPSTTEAVVPDPFDVLQWRSLAWRLGLPVAGAWVVGGLMAGFAQSSLWIWVGLGGAALITTIAVAVVVWALRQAKKARAVASILKDATADGDHAAAIERLESSFKKNDPAKIFAKANLQMQSDPDAALATLEEIDLSKVTPQMADEARVQRAMILLIKGQVAGARQLIDAVELKRHQDPRSRALMVAVCSEAWARSGGAAKAIDTLDTLDPDDAAFSQVRPQLLRARAYALAHTGDAKAMRRTLKQLCDIDARLLAGFMVKKNHPLLQKEARMLLERSGAVPRRVVMQRR